MKLVTLSRCLSIAVSWAQSTDILLALKELYPSSTLKPETLIASRKCKSIINKKLGIKSINKHVVCIVIHVQGFIS
jgi:hypothetical protein